MGFLDDLIRRKPKVKDEGKKPVVVDNPIVIEMKPETAEPKTVGTLNLEKKIGLNLNKLNFDKKEVREKRLFLLDVSGSMDEKTHDGERKIVHLRNVMKNYSDVRMICFSSGVQGISNSDEIPTPNGSTKLANAFRYVKGEDKKPERIVLVSDGEPDSKDAAIKEAINLGIPVDIIFIGDEGSKGDKFMKDLAAQTGGQHFTV